MSARPTISSSSRSFPARWMHRGLTPTMKAAMRIIGVPVGDPYPPYAALDPEETKALAAFLKTTLLAETGLVHADD